MWLPCKCLIFLSHLLTYIRCQLSSEIGLNHLNSCLSQHRSFCHTAPSRPCLRYHQSHLSYDVAALWSRCCLERCHFRTDFVGNRMPYLSNIVNNWRTWAHKTDLCNSLSRVVIVDAVDDTCSEMCVLALVEELMVTAQAVVSLCCYSRRHRSNYQRYLYYHWWR